jgi:glycosyltransferase involved in cell wall biosynthesis
MKIGMLAASMSRSAGGLFLAIPQLSSALVDQGVDVEIYSGRDAFSDLDRSAWGDMSVHVQRQVGPAGFGFQPELMSALRKSALDILHLHGLWMYPSVAALRWSSGRRPRIVSPHGMLDAWALRHSGWKKRIVSRLYEDANLMGATCLHALCESELRAIRSLGLTGPVAVIPNGVNPAIADEANGPPPWASLVPAGCKVLLFLGRVHPKKGVENLIRAMAVKSHSRPPRAWMLVVAGWDQGGYEARLIKLTKELNVDDVVKFVGPQFGADKANSLAAAHAFILPSLSEGLPMAVLEAWAFSLPVLMTRECNLPEGLAADAAILVGHDPATIARQLCALEDTPSSDLEEMGRKGRRLVQEKFAWNNIGGQMHSVYKWMLGGGGAPVCVHS